jgi:DNA ligase-1
MTPGFKPMLATDYDSLRTPFSEGLFASPKLDGVRAIVMDGIVYSRSLKPIPNIGVQQMFKHLEHFDGELILGDPTAKDCYRQTVSAVMSVNKVAPVDFYVFDHVEDPSAPYVERLAKVPDVGPKMAEYVRLRQEEIYTWEALQEFEEEALYAGFEGVILRRKYVPYKFGRSTANEGYLLKVKQFVDDEFEVIDFEERMHNGNEATTNELGRTKRSSHKENKTGRGDLGALVVKTKEGVVFNVGTGFDDAERARVWKHRDRFLGKLAKVKYFPVGVKDAPRHPVFLGWRSKIDL